jgi:hypothetical protein
MTLMQMSTTSSSQVDETHIDHGGANTPSTESITESIAEDRFANLRSMGEVVSASLFDTSDDRWGSDDDVSGSADAAVKEEPMASAESVTYDYVFVGEGDLCMSDVQRLLSLVAASSPTIGNSLDQASRASRVLLIGDVDEAVMATLVQRSVQIERLGDPR